MPKHHSAAASGRRADCSRRSNEEVGERLGISPRTAKAHSDVLRQKLGVTRRRQIPVAYRSLTGSDPLSQGLGLASVSSSD